MAAKAKPRATKSFRMNISCIRLLEKLCKIHKRRSGNMVEYLIIEDAERHGLKV